VELLEEGGVMTASWKVSGASVVEMVMRLCVMSLIVGLQRWSLMGMKAVVE